MCHLQYSSPVTAVSVRVVVRVIELYLPLAVLVAGNNDHVVLWHGGSNDSVDLVQVGTAQHVRYHPHLRPKLGAEPLLLHHVAVAAAPDLAQ